MEKTQRGAVQTRALKAVEFRSVGRSYGQVHANRNVSFSVAAGEIHAIVGENGAGKSTAMNLLYGMSQPNEGEILIFGKAIHFSNPQEAIRLGIGMVHQHFMLSPPHSILDNIILGAEPGHSLTPIPREAAKREISALCKKIEFELDLDAPIESLTVGAEQRVEILKALYRKAKILILDEPTAVLTPQEVSHFFQNIQRMKAEGMTILMITHKLKEVMEIADAITVFRRGEVTGTFRKVDVTIEKLAEEMVGRKVVLPKNLETYALGSEVILELREKFKLYKGEILGIAGVEGNGQGALVEEILGISRGNPRIQTTVSKNTVSKNTVSKNTTIENADSSGAVFLNGKSIEHLSVKERLEAGISCIPEDRHLQGVALQMTVLENFIFGQEENFSRFGFVR